jgi:hypothetical protein
MSFGLDDPLSHHKSDVMKVRAFQPEVDAHQDNQRSCFPCCCGWPPVVALYAFLHRVRGEILLKRDPANTLPAEQSFHTAIGIAKQQKARSFELRAALSLAKLYRSTRRSADAHAVLTSALEGFTPTPYLPQIEEAQALLAWRRSPTGLILEID